MMKRGLLIFVLIATLGFFAFYFSAEINPAKENISSKTPNDWFFRQRAFPFQEINHTEYLKAIKTAKLMQKSDREDVSWEFAGPTNIEGRITDIELDAGNPQIIYFGAASGGVFKSNDEGSSWNPIFDNQSSLSIGDIAISSSDPNIIYVGTGEANAGGGSLSYDGTGIFKSTDAGENWSFAGLENSGSIGRMLVDPHNKDVVYVAAMGRLFSDGSQGGIFKTTDGGQNWEQKLFISDSTGAIDIVVDPSHTQTLYAAMWERVRRPGRRSYGGPTSGIYKSTDGGENWTELTNGLPTAASEKGRIGIDICASNPNVLYAVYADQIGYLQGIYKSTDEGQTWLPAGNGVSSNAYSSYGWWFGRIKADPVDPDIAYLIAFDLYKTETGGNSWDMISGWSVHVDQHAVAINPQDNEKVFLGNDGGFYFSNNGGNSWDWNANLPITQFYTCEVDEQHPERIYGGTQDNGTNRTMTGNLNDWSTIYGGDGFRVLVDPVDNNYVFAEYQYGGLGRSVNGGSSFMSGTNGIPGGQRFNWNSPLVFDPQNPEILYFGSQILYKSTNHGQMWNAISGDLTNGDDGGNIAYNTLTTISVSPLNQNIIYTGSDDGNVYFTENGGTNWNIISMQLPNRWVTSVAADPFEENTVYVTFSGYRWDDYLSHVFRSQDNGQNWEDISSGLPETPINEIIIDAEKEGYLYVATDVGVYYSPDNGQNWETAGSDLPIIVVNDLRLHNSTRKLVAASFGRGIYTLDLSILTNLKENNFANQNTVKCFPNPFTSNLNIEIEPNNGFNKVEIINSVGQTIKTIYDGSSLSLPKTLVWNTKNNGDHNLKAGVFFVKVSNAQNSIVKKVILK